MILNNGHRPGILKSKGQQLKEADKLIRELLADKAKLEKDAQESNEAMEMAVAQRDRLRVAINALGKHYELTPDSMKAIIQPYLDQWETSYKEQMTKIKQQFADSIKSGKTPQFMAVDNIEKPPVALAENQYQCASCHGVFEKGRSDEAAKTEHDGNFPGQTLDTAVLVCDDCYKKMNLPDQGKPADNPHGFTVVENPDLKKEE